MCGISQNPDTGDYIIVFRNKHCEKCGRQYLDINSKWCKICHLDYFENNFIIWTSGNEEIDRFIQEMQLKINKHTNILFEWISYDQFKNIKKVGKDDDFDIVYSALWKDGPLCYNSYIETENYIRSSNKKVALKYMCDSKNITSKLLDEV